MFVAVCAAVDREQVKWGPYLIIGIACKEEHLICLFVFFFWFNALAEISFFRLYDKLQSSAHGWLLFDFASIISHTSNKPQRSVRTDSVRTIIDTIK